MIAAFRRVSVTALSPLHSPPNARAQPRAAEQQSPRPRLTDSDAERTVGCSAWLDGGLRKPTPTGISQKLETRFRAALAEATPRPEPRQLATGLSDSVAEVGNKPAKSTAADHDGPRVARPVEAPRGHGPRACHPYASAPRWKNATALENGLLIEATCSPDRGRLEPTRFSVSSCPSNTIWTGQPYCFGSVSDIFLGLVGLIPLDSFSIVPPSPTSAANLPWLLPALLSIPLLQRCNGVKVGPLD